MLILFNSFNFGMLGFNSPNLLVSWENSVFIIKEGYSIRLLYLFFLLFLLILFFFFIVLILIVGRHSSKVIVEVDICRIYIVRTWIILWDVMMISFLFLSCPVCHLISSEFNCLLSCCQSDFTCIL